MDIKVLLIAVIRVNVVVLINFDVSCINVPGLAIDLYKVGSAENRRGEKVVKRARGHPVTMVTHGLITHDRVVIEICLKLQVFKVFDVNEHRADVP